MSTPIIGSGKTTLSTHRKTRQQASYKKDWLTGGRNTFLEENPTKVEWRGWLYEENVQSGGKEVAIGWCNKGAHYIAWRLRRGHVEQCMWRKGKLYGK